MSRIVLPFSRNMSQVSVDRYLRDAASQHRHDADHEWYSAGVSWSLAHPHLQHVLTRCNHDLHCCAPGYRVMRQHGRR